MRPRQGMLLLWALLAGCGGDDPASPGNGSEDPPGGGGPVGSVLVGSGVRFTSGHNGSANPAVDTIPAGATVTWTWRGSLPHSVRSVGSPGFTGSGILTGAGTYEVTFATPGVYHYDCGVHGQAMTGTIVVLGPPVTDETQVQTVQDPTGDLLNPGGTPWDLTAFTIARDTGGITVRLDFTSDVISPMSGDTAAIIGYVELDLDQSVATGGGSVVDEFRHDGGSADLGVDLSVDLSIYDADSTVAVYTIDSHFDPHVAGRIRPVFAGHSVTLRLPRGLLGDDDGTFNAATLIGSQHRPTDFMPQAGHMSFSLPGAR